MKKIHFNSNIFYISVFHLKRPNCEGIHWQPHRHCDFYSSHDPRQITWSGVKYGFLSFGESEASGVFLTKLV